jgi:succinate dehydrogenase / fumarate reductase flavoprotein subunit
MGGIPTDKYGQVVIDVNNTILPGLFAAGECACVSVHGANRLGTNSLLDILVFGKYAGIKAVEFAQQAGFQELPQDAGEYARKQLEDIRNGEGDEKILDIASEMKSVMNDHVGVFRTEEGMSIAIEKIRELKSRIKNIKLGDTGKIFNTELLTIWELGNLLDLAEVTAVTALNRKESRGAHAREDFPKRDDVNWLKHSFAWLKDDEIKIDYKPVVITKYQPKERVY